MRVPGNASQGIEAVKELQVTLLFNKENITEPGNTIIRMLKIDHNK